MNSSCILKHYNSRNEITHGFVVRNPVHVLWKFEILWFWWKYFLKAKIHGNFWFGNLGEWGPRRGRRRGVRGKTCYFLPGSINVVSVSKSRFKVTTSVPWSILQLVYYRGIELILVNIGTSWLLKCRSLCVHF